MGPDSLVLVGRFGHEVKVFGPFDDADAARNFANSLGLGDMIEWDVVPLRSPVPDAP